MSLAHLLSLDADCRIRALDALTPDAAGAVHAVREALLADEDAEVRAAAALWLGRSRAAPHALQDALYDTHPSVRAAACRALAQLGARDAASTLGRLALEEPIWWVRRAAVLAYARVARRDAIPRLVLALDDPFWRVRHATIRALLVLGEGDLDRVAMAIRTADETSDRARGALRYVARRLGLDHDDLPGPDARPLPEGLVADPDPAVVAARLEQGLRASSAELVEYVGDPHEALRKAAAERLLASGELRVLLAASLWLDEPRIPHATATVVALLDRLGTRALELAEALLVEPEARPGGAVWALSYMEIGRHGHGVDTIVRACRSTATSVRRAAIGALGTTLASGLGVRAIARDVLVAALADPDADVRRIAAHRLVEADEGEAVAALSFDTEPALVRRLIGRAAELTSDVALLRRAACDDDERTRAGATAALHERGLLSPEALQKARADEDPWVRGATLSDETALDVLANDVDPTLRRAAFVHATQAGLALEAARLVWDAEDPWLRAHSAERLARSPHDSDLELVLRASVDPSLAVRAAAADAVDLQERLPERLAELDEARSATLAKIWLGERATELLAQAPPSRHPEPKTPGRLVEVPEVASPRRLGRSGILVSPLALSGANEPSVASLFGAFNAGCNLFFWEPRYRSLTTFLRESRRRGACPRVIAGTYHATERALREDVERALRRLDRDSLDVFLVFWVRSQSRLEGEVPRALARLKAEGLVKAVGFSTHDREIATSALGRDPWDVVMIRHSAAHPGAEEKLFERAFETDTGVLGFSATNYGRLLKPTGTTSHSPHPPSAAECYRYTLSQKGATACISAPRGGVELVENLAVLRDHTLTEARMTELRAHGAQVREESLDFGRHVRRFPAMPESLVDEMLEKELGLATAVPLF